MVERVRSKEQAAQSGLPAGECWSQTLAGLCELSNKQVKNFYYVEKPWS